MSSVDETGVAAAVVFTTRPQLGRPFPRTFWVITGCVPQNPGVRVKQPPHVVIPWCVCRLTPAPSALFSQPAVVHTLPSVSLHGVLSSFAVQTPVAGTQPRLHSSTVQSVFCVCVCRHTPTPAAFFSHPAVVHRLPSVSLHGVLSSFAVQRPVAGTQPRLHSFTVQSVFCVCVCTHTLTPPAFFSPPAVVHRLPSVSLHGVLSSFAVQRPVAGTQPRLHSSTVQSVFCMCVCTHTLTPPTAFPTTPGVTPSSQPAVVHRSPSVSVHGVLSSFGTHAPVVWSQPRLQSSTVQLGQIGMLFVCWLPEGWLRAHVASFDVVVYPAICSISAGVLSLNGPEAGSWLTT